MKRPLYGLAFLASLIFSIAWAQDPLKEIYPFKPMPLEELTSKV